MKDTATLFVLAVGREGPPLAATKFKLKGLEFPVVFELTTDGKKWERIEKELNLFLAYYSLIILIPFYYFRWTDLLFPYTADAYQKSNNAKDTIAVTTILTPAATLAGMVSFIFSSFFRFLSSYILYNTKNYFLLPNHMKYIFQLSFS